jgi:hypothetical protein
MSAANARVRLKLGALAVPILLPTLLAGCALPWASQPHGELVVHSPNCHCRFSYPATWYFTSGNNDSSKPALGIDSFDSNSADHAPIPTTFASIGIDWQADPIGQLYLAATTHRFSPWPGRHLTVSGWPGTTYSHWTAPRNQGGLYVEHFYVFVPWYQRDYDFWLEVADPAGTSLARLHRVFDRVLQSMTLVLPDATP